MARHSICPRCGDSTNDEDQGIQALCCLWAPKAKNEAECAWCGSDLQPRRMRDGNKVRQVRVFCDKRCSQAYQDDFTRGELSPFCAMGSARVPDQPRCDR